MGSLQEGRSEERFSRNAETDIVCRLLFAKKISVLILLILTTPPFTVTLFPYTMLFRSQWYRYAPSYVSPAYHLLEGFPFIQEPPSGDLQERVLIRHHDYDQKAVPE